MTSPHKSRRILTEIVVEQRVAAPPQVVYQYLTESQLWARWQGADADLDPRRGGIFALNMPNGMLARGEFTELIPARRVAFTWGWVDRPGIPPGSTTVTIDLAPEGDGTLLTLTHSELPPEETEPHTVGWIGHLANLALTVSDPS